MHPLSRLASCLLLLSAGAAAQDDPGAAAQDVLARRCSECHGSKVDPRKKSFRRFGTADQLERLRTDPRLVDAAHPEQSLLLRQVLGEDPEMPMDKELIVVPLPPEDIEVLRRWLLAGAPLPAASSTQAAEVDRVRTAGPGIRLLRVEAQRFVMGSPAGEAGRAADEGQHEVEIRHAFWLGETELTQKQWREVMQTAPWQGKPKTIEADQQPACYLSSDDIEAFCARLTATERAAGRLPEGYVYCLPTEAEWELACRAGSTAAYPFGDDASTLREHAVFQDSRHGECPEPVQSRKPNAWGFHDMLGNVIERCADRVEFDTRRREILGAAADPAVDPLSEHGSWNAVRGGSFAQPADALRCANRSALRPADRGANVGFRVALACRQAPR